MDQSVESGGYTLSNAQFERLRELVYKHGGIALRDEKRQLVCSRLSKRLRVLGLSSFDAYCQRLSQDEGGDELEHLLNAMTTNKTAFYREDHHFEELITRSLKPKLAEARGGPVHFRIWSAGCSSGEEVYTMLITLLDAIPNWEASDIRALASDLDTNMLALGERGVYSQESLEAVPADVARRWFIRGTGDQQGKVRVRRPLRERVAFRHINFVSPHWPIRTKFDAIFCRNALIYFDTATQQRIVSRLLGYLEPGGLLCLGHSESMAGVRPDLESLGRTSYRYTGEDS